jgi:hypothetical protein
MGFELPFGDRTRSWWVDESGMVHDEPIGDAEVLPGRYVLPGLVHAHAHPAVTGGPDGPVALDAEGTRATLVASAETGVTLVWSLASGWIRWRSHSLIHRRREERIARRAVIPCGLG